MRTRLPAIAVCVLVALLDRSATAAPSASHETNNGPSPTGLAVSLPLTIAEGGVAQGLVTINPAASSDLMVNLSSSSGELSVPATVTIPAGTGTAQFEIAAHDNTAREGSRAVLVSATADALAGASAHTTIRDNEIGGYRFSGLTDIVNVDAPFTIAATDSEGNRLVDVSAEVKIELIAADGTIHEVQPSTIQLGGNSGWSGTLRFPPAAATPWSLRARDASGNVGMSPAFDVLRVLPIKTADLVWDAGRNRFFASVPADASNAYANHVIRFNPETLEIDGSVAVGQNPTRIALTSAGEALYVARDQDGTIARIDPSTMAVMSSFALGTEAGYGSYYARDMCSVPGNPDLLVVARYLKTVSGGNTAAVYDRGVVRPKIVASAPKIEPSADPAVFFAYNSDDSEFGFRRMRLDASGLTTEAVSSSLLAGFYTDFKAGGDTVFDTGGGVTDGATMSRLGTISGSGLSLPCPDLALGRVYFVEASASAQFGLLAYDLKSFGVARRLQLPGQIWARSFVRFGRDQLAIGSNYTEAVWLITSRRIVPADPPADVGVSIEVPGATPFLGESFAYRIQVTNRGPNTAHGVVVNIALSDGQFVQSAAATKGFVITDRQPRLALDSLAPGEMVTVTLTMSPGYLAGLVTCKATATSSAIDPSTADNLHDVTLSVGTRSAVDKVSSIALPANNLAYDKVRNRLWVTVRNQRYPAPTNAFPDHSLVAIDPETGLTSRPIPLGAATVERSMAISANGRYLYVGLYNVGEVCRIDLSRTPAVPERIPIGRNASGTLMCAGDIEVLEGDGTSFLITDVFEHCAAVFDGAVPRPHRTARFTVSCIGPTANPGAFVGYNNQTFPSATYALMKLDVTPEGVRIAESNSNVVRGYAVELSAAGGLVMTRPGMLIDAASFSIKANVGLTGTPLLDVENDHAYILRDWRIYGFDINSGAPIGSMAAMTSFSDWGALCVRWGLDGFAVAGHDGILSIARWSATIPIRMDRDGDLISDAWEAAYFNTLEASPSGDIDRDGVPNALEFVFGTDPTRHNVNPAQVSVSNVTGESMLHIRYPRRVGLPAGAYTCETSIDLQQWIPCNNVKETVLATEDRQAFQVETIDAAIPIGSAPTFARIRWLGR